MAKTYRRKISRKNSKRKNMRKKSGKKSTIKRVRMYKKKSMRRMHRMRGGSGVPNGPVGYSWNGGNPATWPGVEASKGMDTQGMAMSNHFALSKNGVLVGGIEPARSTKDDPISTPPQNGGRRRKGRRGKYHQKGGFLQDIVNLGRQGVVNVQSTIDGIYGMRPPVSPYPYEDQPINADYKFVGTVPPDVRQIYVKANETVGKL